MNLPLQIDRTAQIPLQDQLFEQLRQLILTGRLKPNTRIIATRFLAEQVGISRRTVLFAYERLIAEGYLETRPAIGTFVSPTLPDGTRPPAALNGTSSVPRQALLFPASFAQPDVRQPADLAAEPKALSAIPPKLWHRRMRDALDGDPDIFARPVPAAGVESLRRMIADHLAATRGLAVSPEQIIVVAGRRHVCSLVAQLFQSERIIMEAPGDDGVAESFRMRGSEVACVAVDESGLDPARLPPGPVSLVHVTPTRQNPLGVTMALPRRVSLIEWARGAGAYIVEDDCDGELRYHGVAHPPLAALDPYGLVFYAGSFATVLGAGTSVAFVVAPPEFAAVLAAIKAIGMESGHGLEQTVVAGMIAGGEYDHYLRRLRKVCLERRDGLIAALKTHFGDVELMGSATGTRLTWILPSTLPPASVVCEIAGRCGVRMSGVVDLQWRASPFFERAVMIEYAALPPDRAGAGVGALARALAGRA